MPVNCEYSPPEPARFRFDVRGLQSTQSECDNCFNACFGAYKCNLVELVANKLRLTACQLSEFWHCLFPYMYFVYVYVLVDMCSFCLCFHISHLHSRFAYIFDIFRRNFGGVSFCFSFCATASQGQYFAQLLRSC